MLCIVCLSSELFGFNLGLSVCDLGNPEIYGRGKGSSVSKDLSLSDEITVYFSNFWHFVSSMFKLSHKMTTLIDIFMCCATLPWSHHEETRKKEMMKGTMPGAHRRGRPHTAWMDNINTWAGLPVEESVRMTEDRDKWRKYVHGVTNPRIKDGLPRVYLAAELQIELQMLQRESATFTATVVNSQKIRWRILRARAQWTPLCFNVFSVRRPVSIHI